MKKTHLYILTFAFAFIALISITIDKFNDIKAQYKAAEPDLVNYSTAEVLFLSFERMKLSLLDAGNHEEFVVARKIFNSKIKILENKSSHHDSFFYDPEFITLIKKIKAQSTTLSTLYSDQNQSTEALNYMRNIHTTLVDLQEIIYKIQINHFNETKTILKDNTSITEFYSLLCIILFFTLIALLWRHITILKDTLIKKNIFISVIYHEFSNSIQKIQISSEMLDSQPDDATLGKYLNIIKLHSNKLLDQTREILEYSKIEIGNSKLTNSTFYLKTLISDALSSCEEINKNLFIIKAHSSDKLIHSDKQKLLSIIINLIDNANKNTINGKILITLKIFDSHLYIKVKDNGCGFNIKELKSLYQPFNQGAEKFTKQGLGLGLTIVKSYVKLFNGKVKVKSIKGYGSSFLIRIRISILPH